LIEVTKVSTLRLLKKRGAGHCKSGNRLTVAIILLLLALYAQRTTADETYQVTQLEISVYRDGVAHVRYVISVNSTVPSISLSLFGEAGNVLVTDEKGQIMRYDLTVKDITIYTLGATKVLFEYDTSTMTRKDGPVWTLRLNLTVPGRVILPDEAAVVYLSEKPASIEAKDGKPILTLTQGVWEISYVIPLKTSSSTTTSQILLIPSSYVTIMGATALGVLLLLVLATFLRRRTRFVSEPLSAIDTQVLDLIRSRGGRLFESELRDLLGIPKTSAWRRVKKLEKMGLLRTRKVSSQNEIELV
jgi:uncharacterized membrane protein